MERWTMGIATFLVVAMVQDGHSQKGAFLLKHGADTVSLEIFNRTDKALETELFIPAAGTRAVITLSLDKNGLPTKLVTKAWLTNDSAGAAPRHTAAFTFDGDSVVIEIETNFGPDRRVAKSGPSSFPHVNPSFALWEPMLTWAKKNKKTEIPLYDIGGGAFKATLTWVGADSVLVSVPGGDVRLAFAGGQRIQGGTVPSQQLIVTRSDGAVKRPAIGGPDYSAPKNAPYTAVDVTVPTNAGHTLAGTLTIPKTASRSKKVAAVVTITGSGLQDRDEALPSLTGYRPFRDIADTLSRRGIAVLRLDDRGFGRSTGSVEFATTADFAEDIKAAIAYLQGRPDIDPKRIALIGHSEGGIIAPLIARDQPGLRGIVLMAGTASSGREIMAYQVTQMIKTDTTLSKAQRDSALLSVEARVDSMTRSPWAGFFAYYEPRNTAKQVSATPVLILHGANDQQIPPTQADELAEAFKEAGNKDVTAQVLPGINHLFLRDADGSPNKYFKIANRSVDPAVLRLIADWVAKRLKI